MKKLTNIDAYKLMHDGALALSMMEREGLHVDVRYLKREIRKSKNRIKQLEEEFRDSKFFLDWQKTVRGKINVNSGPQLGKFLYEIKGYEPRKFTPSGKGSTDEEALSLLNIKELDMLLDMKKEKKASDYLKAILREQVDGIVHPFFHLHLARTFRSSSDRPNWQNIPVRNKEVMKLVRSSIIPSPGHQLLELDYGQLEVRIATCYHKDPTMMHEIETGHDFHKDLAIEIFKLDEFDKSISGHDTLRKAAKNGFVFPQFYGDYYKNNAESLATQWCHLPMRGKWKEGEGIEIGSFVPEYLTTHLIKKGIRSYSAFEKHLREIEDKFWRIRYPIYKKWKETWWRKYQKKGRFESLTGFTYKGLFKKNDVINYPVQGSAFHVTLLAIIEAHKAKARQRWKTKIVSETHDSILLDVPPNELEEVIKIMKCIMENDVRQIWDWIIVPLEIEADLGGIDKSWAEKQFFDISKF
jgi:DNA polymerase I